MIVGYFHHKRWAIASVHWERKSGLSEHQVSGMRGRSEQSIGIAVLAYWFVVRACHHEIVPGHLWSIFQLQYALQLRVMTNQIDYKVKAKMAKGRKVA